MTLFYIIVLLILLILNYKLYYTYVEYYSQIVNKSKIPDFTRWILSDKYVAKLYAEINGFKVAKTFQLVKYPHHLKFNHKSYVVKPVDLCDSTGVYIVKNNLDLKSGKEIDTKKIVNELHHLRANIFSEHYMHSFMYNGLIPYNGYIMEELLLDNNEIPCDYKCYVFGGRLYYTAMTYDRKIIDGKQNFKSVWFSRDWTPIRWSMIKFGYKYKKLEKPKGYNKMIELVEKMGKKLKRHCRIDVYLIDGDVYFGEFTFFCGASLHTFICNLILGGLWIMNPDDYTNEDPIIKKIVPNFYNQI